MFQPLSLFVGLRYVRARSHKFFVSFITWVSLAGVSVGVAALIVILSVMNGFEGELRDRLLSLSAQVRVAAAPGEPPPDWSAASAAVAGLPELATVESYAELQVLAVREPEMLPMVLRGVAAGSSGAVGLARVVDDGTVDSLAASPDAVLLGRLVADQLATAVGDRITLLVPVVSDTGVPEARLREFTVVGTFEAGVQDHDATLAFASLEALEALGARSAGAEGLRISATTPLAAPRVAARVAATLGPGFAVRDWTQDHASYFRAIRIEKTMMALILTLIVAVAAFNIVAMLVMVVTDKRTDIAILRTLGAGPARVAGVFLTQGLAIGWLGVAAGVAAGVALARNVAGVVPALERLLGIRILDADVYYITQIPSELHWNDVMLVGCVALLLTTLATVYPALRAAATPPAEALRYE